MPIIYEQPEYSVTTAPRSQTNLLLDNVSKIERTYCKELLNVFYYILYTYVLYKYEYPIIELIFFGLINFLAYKDQMEKSRFVFKFVQAARSRKTKKKTNRKTTISSMTSDTLSMDSSSTVSYKSP